VREKARKLHRTAQLNKDGYITDSGLAQLCSAIEDGDAHSVDIRAAVRRIYESQIGIVPGGPLSYREWEFLCLAFARYLDGLTFDQAFGVVRSHTGHPGASLSEQRRIARAMWAEYLRTTDTLKVVATRVGENLGRGTTQALLYFHRHFEASYVGFALRRLKQNPNRVLTHDELQRYQKLSRLHKKRADRLGSAPLENTVTRNADGTITVKMPPPHERYLRRKSLPKKRIIGQRKNRKP
jgi:hypothetical protein